MRSTITAASAAKTSAEPPAEGRQYDQPKLAASYFETTNAGAGLVDGQDGATVQLPNELMSMCLLECADWGDLAKLACVQSSWKDIVDEAANTDQQSKWQLAQAYLHGDCGLQQDPEKAMRYFRELSCVDMDEQTGTFAIHGDGSGDNKPYAPAMRQLAAHQFSMLTDNMENHYADETQDEHDSSNSTTTIQQQNEQLSKLGTAWLQAAHDLGDDADAAHELALHYEYGKHHVAVDVVAAYEWFQKAATAGHVDAMAELGLCYELGCGVEQDDELALDWYTKAANEGNVTAKFSVGEAFEEARGVPQSDEEACLWYYRAAMVGDEDSKVALKRLYDIARIVVPGVATLLNV